MGSSLFWEPANRKKGDLSDEIKYALRKRFGDSISARMDNTHVAYLQGLYDAGIKDAQKLINAIDKYEEIIIQEEY